MSNLFQKTILKKVDFKGVGLHDGLESTIKIIPADVNYGILFKRTDLEKNNTIKANFENVSSTKLCTTIQNNFNVSISTVEHLLAALYITGIDNALIEISAPEVPIMDGSSKEFVETILKTGTKEQKIKKKYLKILKKFEIKDNEKFISIEPNENSLNVDFELVYSNNVIGKQRNQINFSDKDLSNVYTSRTFCLFEDVEKIKPCLSSPYPWNQAATTGPEIPIAPWLKPHKAYGLRRLTSDSTNAMDVSSPSYVSLPPSSKKEGICS